MLKNPTPQAMEELRKTFSEENVQNFFKPRERKSELQLSVAQKAELRRLDNHYEEKRLLGILHEARIDVTKQGYDKMPKNMAKRKE
jgi:hypothetical protein